MVAKQDYRLLKYSYSAKMLWICNKIVNKCNSYYVIAFIVIMHQLPGHEYVTVYLYHKYIVALQQ